MNRGALTAMAHAARRWAGAAIPEGFVVKAGTHSEGSMHAMSVHHYVRLRVECGSRYEQRGIRVDATLSDADLRRWAEQSAKDMAHLILMGMNTHLPTPQESSPPRGCSMCGAVPPKPHVGCVLR